MDALHLLFTAVTVIFIAATMFAAGLGTTPSALRGIVANLPLLALALVANMVVIPLLGWGIAALFGLATAPFIALVLVASSPGGPFGAKLAMVQKGDLVTGAAMQVLLASIGSVTFGPTSPTESSRPPTSAAASHSMSARWCEPWPSCSSCPSPETAPAPIRPIRSHLVAPRRR